MTPKKRQNRPVPSLVARRNHDYQTLPTNEMFASSLRCHNPPPPTPHPGGVTGYRHAAAPRRRKLGASQASWVYPHYRVPRGCMHTRRAQCPVWPRDARDTQPGALISARRAPDTRPECHTRGNPGGVTPVTGVTPPNPVPLGRLEKLCAHRYSLNSCAAATHGCDGLSRLGLVLHVVRQLVLCSVASEVSFTEVGDRVSTVFFILFLHEPVVDKKAEPMCGSPFWNLDIVSSFEVIPDVRGLERKTGLLEKFEDRVVVLPIHPRNTRAHVTRRLRDGGLFVPKPASCCTSACILLHSTVQSFIFLWGYAASNDHAPGSRRVHFEEKTGLPSWRESGVWSSNRPMQNFEPHRLKTRGGLTAAQTPSKRPHRAPFQSNSVRALEQTAANQSTRTGAVSNQTTGGGRRAEL